MTTRRRAECCSSSRACRRLPSRRSRCLDLSCPAICVRGLIIGILRCESPKKCRGEEGPAKGARPLLRRGDLGPKAPAGVEPEPCLGNAAALLLQWWQWELHRLEPASSQMGDVRRDPRLTHEAPVVHVRA